MKNWIIYSLILLGSSFPFTSYALDASSADCFLVEGWGTTAINGTYIYYGQYGGQPAFVNTTTADYYLKYYSANPNWMLVGTGIEGSLKYYQDPTTLDPTAGGTWVKSSGIDPIGTVVRVDCDEPPPETTAQTYGDWLFVSVVQVFLLSFIGIGMLFSVFRQKR